MKTARLAVASVILFSGPLLCGALDGEEFDLQKIVADTQRAHQEKNAVTIVWWIPSEFWETSLKANSALTVEQRAEFIKVVDEYLVVAVIEAKIGAFGALTGTSKDDLHRKITVTIGKTELSPLRDDVVSDEARAFFQMMKPMFANMMGKLGQSMEFIPFQGKTPSGARSVDPRKEGLLAVKLGDKQFKFRLPLGCFLPPKYDPETGEEFPGNYVYSPFAGNKLTTVKPAKPNGADK